MKNLDQKRILVVLTSHACLGDTRRKTGLWLSEFVEPYYTWFDAGIKMQFASPQGGIIPIDPASMEEDMLRKPDIIRWAADKKKILQDTLELKQMKAEDFDAVFYPGGHGPMWDLASNCTNAMLLDKFFCSGKIIAAVCHGPAALTGCVRSIDGKPLVYGRCVSGFSDAEETVVGLNEVVPFSLEQKLKGLGADYSAAAPWHEHVVSDGRLVTGQNPASALGVARAVLDLLSLEN